MTLEERRAYHRDYAKARYKRNPEYFRLLQKKYAAKHPEKVKDRWHKYKAENGDKIKAQQKAYRDANKDREKARRRQHYLANKAEAIEYTAKRRAARLKATPSWLTAAQLNEISSIYKECQAVSKATGVLHHVDHIIPLQNSNVCGLHVPWNLQVITEKANQSKGNKFTCH